MTGEELDRTLDQALATYTLEIPRAGFHARMMARARTDRDPSRWGWLQLAAAGLLLAALLAGVRMWPSVPPPPQLVRLAAPVPVVQVASSISVVPRPPRPNGSTAEQRALLVFAQLAPEAARDLAKPDKPLEIEPLQIEPLEIANLKTGEVE